MPLNTTKSGWLTITETADQDVRATVQHIIGMEAVRKTAGGKKRRPLLEKRLTARTQSLSTPKITKPLEVGRSAPAFHRKLAKRRETTIIHPVNPHDFGEIAAVTHQRFPRFQHKDVGHPETFFDSVVTHRILNVPVLHDSDRGLHYGAPRVGSRSYRSLTDRATSPGKLQREQAVLVVVPKPTPPPLSRNASLTLAVRGWHAVERGTLPGGPSVARRQFEHLPAWEKTSRAQFSREQATLMLEDALAGRPSPLGLVSSARPSLTGGQQRWKHPLHVGESGATELGAQRQNPLADFLPCFILRVGSHPSVLCRLDRNLPCNVLVPDHTSTKKLVPSVVDAHVMIALGQERPSNAAHHRLNDKGTGLRSQVRFANHDHSASFGLNSTVFGMNSLLFLAERSTSSSAG